MIVAHAGGFGWDELVFLALPVLIILLLGRQARKKAEASERAERPTEGSPDARAEEG